MKNYVYFFKEVNAVKAALSQQLKKSIDNEYLNAVRSRVTNTLEGPVSAINDHLYEL